jgi:hypothetical protein
MKAQRNANGSGAAVLRWFRAARRGSGPRLLLVLVCACGSNESVLEAGQGAAPTSGGGAGSVGGAAGTGPQGSAAGAGNPGRTGSAGGSATSDFTPCVATVSRGHVPAASVREAAVVIAVAQARCQPAPSELEALSIALASEL